MTPRVQKTLPYTLSLIAGVVGGLMVNTTAGNGQSMSFTRSQLAVFAFGVVLAWIIAPIAVSLIARRRYFLFSFLPGAVMLLTMQAAIFVQARQLHEPPFTREDFRPLSIIAASLLACVTATAGPVSLTRYILQLRRSVAIAQETAAPVENADKEGAWPPPPAVK